MLTRRNCNVHNRACAQFIRADLNERKSNARCATNDTPLCLLEEVIHSLIRLLICKPAKSQIPIFTCCSALAIICKQRHRYELKLATRCACRPEFYIGPPPLLQRRREKW